MIFAFHQDAKYSPPGLIYIDFFKGTMYNANRNDDERGLRQMMEISAKIDKIIETPSKKPTKQEAMKVLRSCGILNRNNGVKAAYKDILVKKASKEDGNA